MPIVALDRAVRTKIEKREKSFARKFLRFAARLARVLSHPRNSAQRLQSILLPSNLDAYVSINDTILKDFAKARKRQPDLDLEVTNDWADCAEGFPPPKFTVALPTRFRNNADHRLFALLFSIYFHAALPDNFEILLAVDIDDDLNYFSFLRKEFQNKLNVRIILGESNRGYRNLHRINAELMSHIAPTSGGVLSLSDDTFISRNYWDVGVLSMIVAKPSQLFMAFPIPNPSAAASEKFELAEFLSHLYCSGPRSFHPFLSRRLIGELQNLTAHEAGWGVFGNTVMSDSFFDILAFELMKTHAFNVIVPMFSIGCLFKQTLTAHKEGGMWGDSPVIREALRQLYSENSIAFIKEIASALARSAIPSRPRGFSGWNQYIDEQPIRPAGHM
jgi:hypothetical protein